MCSQSIIGAVFDTTKNTVLLVQRRDVPVWVLPGGGLEENESPEEAVLREIKEETGYDAEVVRKVGEYTPVNRLAKFTYLFECRLVGGKACNSDESRDVRFFPLRALPKLLPPPYPEWIQEAWEDSSSLIRRDLTSVNYKTLAKSFLLHPVLVLRFLLSKIGLTINSSTRT